jgi:hypothetical protein
MYIEVENWFQSLLFQMQLVPLHIGQSEDVHKIVLATVTAWKDSSTQRQGVWHSSPLYFAVMKRFN